MAESLDRVGMRLRNGKYCDVDLVYEVLCYHELCYHEWMELIRIRQLLRFDLTNRQIGMALSSLIKKKLVARRFDYQAGKFNRYRDMPQQYRLV